MIDFKNTIPKNSNCNIYDVSGNLILTTEFNLSQLVINTERVSAGIYFVQITTAYKTENF